MEQCSICLESLDGGVVALAACGHRFHAACLAQMAGAVGTATTRRGSLTACPNCRTVSRVAPVTPAAFSIGDRVSALWGHKWFPGVVDGVINNGRAYQITWDDGDAGDVFAAHVRAAAPVPARRVPRRPTVPAPVVTFSVGDRVLALWGHEFYPGVVDEVVDSGRAYEIKWDDGDEGRVLAKNVRVAAQAPVPAPRRPAVAPAEPRVAAPSTAAPTPRRLMRCGNCKACRRRQGRPCRTPVPFVPRNSRFTGVHLQRDTGKWRVVIGVRGQRIELGQFDDEEDAARAYDAAVAKYEISGRTLNFPGETPLASVLAALPELDDEDDATATNEDAAQHRTTTKGEYDALVATAASATAAPRHERSIAARRVAPPMPLAPRPIVRRDPGNPLGKKPVEMRRIGDAEWRWFGGQADAARAFGVDRGEISKLVRNPSKTSLRVSFEARSAQGPPKKRERPTKGKAGRKKAKTVEGALQKKNGKWSNSVMFPGREFDDLDEYRAAREQRAARRLAWSAQCTHRGL